MNIQVRGATVEDAAAACDVIRRSIRECCGDDHHEDPKVIEAWLRNKTPEVIGGFILAPDAFAVVAEADRAITGFAMASRTGEIMLCYVAPRARFTGAGKALLAAIENHAAQTGVEALHLQSTRSAREFYLRNGFVPEGPPVQAFGLQGQPMRKKLA
jgi:GNAT superfamily N-acetyltransferase